MDAAQGETMKTKLSRSGVLALLAAAGVATSTSAVFADSGKTAKDPALKVADKTASPSKGKESACGEGACGTDEKGAQSAKDRDKKKTDKKPLKPKTECKGKEQKKSDK
jgi:uncharacterized low-complexity protein